MAAAQRLRSLAAGLGKRVVGIERWLAWREAILRERARVADHRTNRRFLVPGPCLAVFSEGGEPRAYQEFLDWLAVNDPALRERIRVGRVPAALPRHTRVLHAWVQDPVRERNPRLFEQLRRLEGQAHDRGIRIIHPAALLSHSRRDVMAQRLRQAGVRSPSLVAVGPGFADTLGGLALPVMLRRNWGHSQPMVRLDSRDAVAAWMAGEDGRAGQWMASEYLDVQSPDGYYRKYRYVMAGDRGVSRHLIVSPRWEVRPKDRVLTDQTVAEELAFVSAPCREHTLFDQTRRALEFEIAAFDYSYDRDGALVVWEVNPYPDLSCPPGRPGRYLAPTVARTFRMLAAFYRQALAEAGASLTAPATSFDD